VTIEYAQNGCLWGFNVSENPEAREISPIRGNFHGSSITATACGRQAFRVPSRFLGRAAGDIRGGPLRGALGRGHGLCCPQSPGRRNIRRYARGCCTGIRSRHAAE
jgi:hypothetical protein